MCRKSFGKYPPEIQIILIDDGSTDRSFPICQVLAKRDSRVNVVHQSNRGVSAARNVGLRMSKGKYITFVDADDFVTEDFSRAVSKAVAADADLFISGYFLVDEDKRKIKQVGWRKQPITVQETIHNLFDYESGLGLKPAVWNKIFLRELIGDICFDEKLSISEDLKFLIEYLTKAQSVILSEEVYYCWRQRENSVTHAGGKVIDISKTVETDYEIYALLSSMVPSESATFLRWMVQDNIGWYRVGNRIAKSYVDRAHLRRMKRFAITRSWRILTCKNIYWKERIIYTLGKW